VKPLAPDLKTMTLDSNEKPATSEWPQWLPLRKELLDLTPYGAPQISNVIHLNTNENPFALPGNVSEAIISRIREVVGSLNRYPDRDAISLRVGLAEYINFLSGTDFDSANIWAANGSNEILQTLLLACGGIDSLALGFTPSYSVHPLISKITNTPWQHGNREADFDLDIEFAISKIALSKPKLVFIANPNNPSGNILTISEIRRLAQICSELNSLLIVDEAYQEFSTEVSAVSLISDFPSVVVTRTMSKAFAFAGARVGYLIAHPKVVAAMLITRLPYHLSSLTQAAAEVALQHRAELQTEVQLLIQERQRIIQVVTALGLQAIPSSANFLLFTGFSLTSAELWQKFLDRGILIRDVGLAGYLRVTVGTKEENDRFLAVLEEVAP
jgi:histidinol-phosphate aminotransferase